MHYLLTVFTVLLTAVVVLTVIGKQVFDIISCVDHHKHSPTKRVLLTVVVMFSPWISLLAILGILWLARIHQ